MMDDVVKSSLQFFLDDDTDGAIALNLSQLVAVEADSSKPRPMMGMSCLHPLLRLLRGLEMNDLSEIDALLGCAIAMPVPAVYTEFSQLSAYQQHLALHCLFHCINWLLEVINCFAFLVKKNEPEKVLMRLRTIVWLRGLLARCLPQAMEYTPPMCHFQALPKPKLTSVEKPTKKATKKKGKKKGKKKQDGEESVLTGKDNGSQQEEEEDEEEPVEEKAADLSKYKYYFREIDIDMWLVLTQPLTLSPSPEKLRIVTSQLAARFRAARQEHNTSSHHCHSSYALAHSNVSLQFT
ncbi:Fanconi anemia group D2 protein [Homalodisca vitripennis]|nr:Fanconi anemia group D2 protein [Homalodisca vitripennis]